tara:strand:+ start:8627 stop:9172 length:546 start_codon:yes stop_codon:yes gene_type:complete
MQDKIIEALGLMDAMDDEQWTADGAPKVDAVKELGDFENLKRDDIINAAPKFSRENPDVSAEEPLEEEVQEPEVNDQGRNHPEIVEAQEAYDEIINVETQVKLEKLKRGEALTEATNRLMNDSTDKLANQRGIMEVIRKSNEARAARAEGFQRNRALLMGQPPMSALDASQKGAKKIRPKM